MLSEKQENFRDRITALSKKIAPQYGVDWRLMTAAAILETGWGTSELARRAKNLFGIKATGRTPEIETYSINGERYRKYANEEDACHSYGWHMAKSSHYAPARDAALIAFVETMSPVYCPPDPKYPEKLMHLIAAMPHD